MSPATSEGAAPVKDRRNAQGSATRRGVRDRISGVTDGTRRGVLSAALGFALLDAHAREVRLLHSWLSTWSGIGHVIVGMHRQGYDVQLTEYDNRGWRATFYVTGMEHSATSATASAFEVTPWEAVQRAAWRALGAVR